jgi:hypothetical protein
LKTVLRIRENASGVNDAELMHKLPSELPAELRAQRVARYRIALLRAVAELEDNSAH